MAPPFKFVLAVVRILYTMVNEKARCCRELIVEVIYLNSILLVRQSLQI
jgi:hypothetical protein